MNKWTASVGIVFLNLNHSPSHEVIRAQNKKPPDGPDDKLNRPFPALLSIVNASNVDPRILIDSVLLPDDGDIAIAQGIQDGCAQIVSDGSFKHDTPLAHLGLLQFMHMREAPLLINVRRLTITNTNRKGNSSNDNGNCDDNVARLQRMYNQTDCR